VRGITISADGARLGFAGLGLSSQIWSQPIKADGSAAGAAHALTTDTSRRNSMAVVSPDGAHVAYMSTRRGEPPNVWVVDIDGANRVQITTDESSDGKPSWFPDSRRVAFFTDRGQSPGLWSVDVTTRRAEPLLDISGSAQLTFAHGRLAEFEISPSMTRGVFAVVSPPEGRRMLFVSPLDAFVPTRLTDPASWIGYPAWSPDERQIAAELKDGSSTHLAIVDARTGAHRQITNERGQTWVRSWSPDGTKVAVAVLRGGAWSLRWVEVASGRQGVITPPGPPHVYMRYPQWSRRNDVVVFERGELRGNIWTLALH
jgi:Tol biopolymer transport system component